MYIQTYMSNLSALKVIAFTYLLSICISTQAQHRHALLVGISEYANHSGWTDIHGENDVKIIRKALSNTQIAELTGRNATHANIVHELELLIKRVRKGDVAYIHFSCHGQPFEDLDGDEQDGWDESFVPYDAKMFYEKGVYEGERHLTDDKLNTYLIRLRNKLGYGGMIYVVVDACHSGGAYRGDEDATADENQDISPDRLVFERGVNVGFSKDKVYTPSDDRRTHYFIDTKEGMSPIVVLEACLPGQRNCEIMRNGSYYGALSYSVASVLRGKVLNRDKTWIRNVEKTMKDVLPKWNTQTMVVEESK
ncbi:MAG: caspase family protein [Prevotellaceae bacterium]|nr:caspase family protein [Candidatus Minthosoma caballi]